MMNQCGAIDGTEIESTGDEPDHSDDKKRIMTLGIVVILLAFIVFGTIVWRIRKNQVGQAKPPAKKPEAPK